MDFAIVMTDGRGEMTFDPAGNIFNNIFLSLKIRRGAWFFNPEFGSRLHLLKKNTPRTASLAEEYVQEALQWLLDTGRAKKIVVAAERDTLQDTSRLKLLVEVTQADGTPVVYSDFVEVV